MKACHSSRFEQEAKEKWGHTPAYQEFEEKLHSNENQDALAAGMDQMTVAFAACMEKGETPDSTQAQSLVKSLQDYITQNHCHCTNEILSGLGQMYVADERFAANIDKHTAAFIRDAIAAYCRK